MSDDGATISALLAAAAADRPRQQAYLDERGGGIDWTTCIATADRIRHAIEVRGVPPGSRVALVFAGRDVLAFVCAMYGAILARCAVVPINAALSAPDVRATAERADIALTIAAPGVDAAAISAVSYPACASAPPERDWQPVPVDPHEPVCVVFSTGTTGRPRGVEISHANMLVETLGRGAPSATGADILLHAFPVESAAALSRLWAPLRAPLRVMTLGLFAPGTIVKELAAGRVASLALVPAMAELLLSHAGSAGASWREVESIVLTGAAMGSPDLCTRLAARFPRAAIETVYGSTEAGPARLRMPVDPNRPACVGRPEQGTEVAVVAADGRPVSTGTPGQVLLRSTHAPQRRYASADAGGASVFRGDGWVATGDIGRLDEDGSLTLVGRMANVINVAGHKLLADEIEAFLRTHPAVVAAAAWGVADTLLGERLEVAVEVHDPSVAADDILRFARRGLPRSDWPAACHVAPNLPRSVKGEVLRRAVAARYAPGPPPDVNARR
jgi:acyl-CoA synthetase (AMP-forming)/AMP-acid ligase II